MLIKNLSALSAGINSLYVGQPYYTGISNLTIINAGLVPDNTLLPMSYGMELDIFLIPGKEKLY